MSDGTITQYFSYDPKAWSWHQSWRKGLERKDKEDLKILLSSCWIHRINKWPLYRSYKIH